MEPVPNSRFSNWWGGYTEVWYCIRGVAAFLGFNLWVQFQRERRIGLAALLEGAALVWVMLSVILWDEHVPVTGRIHLFTVDSAGVVLMYFVTGYVMIHPKWFGGREARPPSTPKKWISW